MADGTHIEWTDATWNPITGCSVVSPGCTNCYAMKLAGTRLKHHPSRAGLTIDTKAGPVWNGKLSLNEQWLDQPLRWSKPRMIFVCAHGDLFHEDVPDEWIDKVFAVMALAPHHIFQVLTKRSARMRAYMEAFVQGDRAVVNAGRGMASPGKLAGILSQAGRDYPACCPLGPLPNVWLGVSVEDQKRADERIPDLLATPAAVRWLSMEPLLGPVDLGQLQADCPTNGWLTWLDALDWVVLGGESGPGARPMHPDWARSVRDQCEATQVPFHFKQWGTWASVFDRDIEDPDWRRCGIIARRNEQGQWLNLAGGQGFHGERVVRVEPVGKKSAGRLLDGVEHNGFPERRP